MLATYEFRGRRLLQAVLVVPFVLPTVVVGAAFLSLLGPAGLLGVDLRGSAVAILLAHAFFNHAVVVRTVGGLWEGLDPSTEEAARVLGASRWRAFRHVTWPAIRPAVASAAAIVFLFTFTSFGVVRILGGPARSTLETEIYRQTADLLDLPVASVLALLQLARGGRDARGARLARAASGRRRRSRCGSPVRRPVRGRGDRAWFAGQPRAHGGVARRAAGWCWSTGPFQVGDGHGLAGWRALGGVSEGSRLFVSPLEAVANSLRFAAVATVLAVVLGGLAAAALARSPGPRRALASTPCCSCRSAPRRSPSASASSSRSTSRWTSAPARGSSPLAQAVVAIPFVVRTMTPGAALDRPAPAGGGRGARRVAATGVARRGPPARVAGGARGRGVRVRHLARRVRRHRRDRPRRRPDGARSPSPGCSAGPAPSTSRRGSR